MHMKTLHKILNLSSKTIGKFRGLTFPVAQGGYKLQNGDREHVAVP